MSSRDSTFFDGVDQIDLELDGEACKVPIFYYDGTAQTAVFPARLGALRRMLPDRRFLPARLAPGLGAIGITCFEYRDTDIGPYNELAVSIVLSPSSGAANLPGRALVGGLRSGQLNAWVHHLPVTTEVARVSGIELYNYPKFLASIEFTERDGERVCRLADGDTEILTLSGKAIETEGSGSLQIFSHLWMDRQPQRSEFKIETPARGRSFRLGAARLELADGHPIARELAGAVVSNRSTYYELMSRFQGILYGPEHLTLPLVDKISRHRVGPERSDGRRGGGERRRRGGSGHDARAEREAV